ncbi:unnamed protein product [Oreochromis niloticus]|nr:unnamed protein product [Mustela putorius furo]
MVLSQKMQECPLWFWDEFLPHVKEFKLNSVDVKYQIWKLGVVFTDNLVCLVQWWSSFSLSYLGHVSEYCTPCAFGHSSDVAALKYGQTANTGMSGMHCFTFLAVGSCSHHICLTKTLFFAVCKEQTLPFMDRELLDYCNSLLSGCPKNSLKSLQLTHNAAARVLTGTRYMICKSIHNFNEILDFRLIFFLSPLKWLIIDAFGDLRDQQEQVKEDMETKCFICGIGNDYFDTVPHGFETHTLQEHNLANYLFFLMYLINKDETEHTGQESYVWKMYQERCWEFFPAGDCFRKQYEDQLN